MNLKTSHVNLPCPRHAGHGIMGALGAALMAIAGFADAAEPPAATDPAIAAICAEMQQAGLLNGVVLVADGDMILHHQAYGPANVEHGVALTLGSRFMVASVTKALTACAVLQTVEQGKLDLTRPISGYLPELAGSAAGEVTAHQLLSHSGGLTAFVEDQMEPYASAALWSGFRSAKVNAAGAGKFDYQNENFMLLALLLEKLHAADFATILQRQIFEPLGMHDSGVNVGGRVVERLAPGYEKKEGEYRYPPLNNLTQTIGSGCVYASAADLLKFLQAVARGRILKPETVEWLRSPKAGPYSYGWFTRQSQGARIIAAFGRMPGYSSLIASHEDGRAFVVLNNIYDSPVTPLLQRLVATRAVVAPSRP